MPGRGALMKPASDPARIVEACARARRVAIGMTDLHIGNFAISTPVIKALQRGFAAQRAETRVIVARPFAPLAQRLLDPTDLIEHDAPGSILGDIGGLRRTRRALRGVEALLILGGGVRGSTLAKFSGVPTTISLDRYRRSALYTLRIEDRDPAHMLDRYAQFTPCAGGAPPVIEPFTPMEGDDEAARSALTSAGLDPEAPLTVIHPGAGKPNRIWPAERFAQVADHAVETHGHAVAVLTPPGEEATTEALLGAMRHPESARPVTLPLATLMPLFDRARAFVGNESGPMHLAAMTRCAIVALFGPTDPGKWAPIRTGNDVAVLRNGEAVESIGVEDVASALDRTLGAVAAH